MPVNEPYRARLLIGIGSIALLLSLVILIPARFAVSLIGPPPGMVSGVSGTVWHGEIRHVVLGGQAQSAPGSTQAGRLALGPVQWRVKPGRLLLATLAADVRAELPEGFLSTELALSARGVLTLNDLEAAAPMTWIAPGTADPGSQLSARFEQLAIADDRITAAVGSLRMAGVVLPIATRGGPLGPGSYTLTFDAGNVPAGQPLTGELKDAGGPLELTGTVLMTPPRSYEIRGTAKARPNAPPELRDALTMLGPALPDGGHALSLAGTF